MANTLPPLHNPEGFRGGYRLWTVANGRPFDSFETEGRDVPSLITLDEWPVRVAVRGRITLRVQRPADDGTVERHNLDGTDYADVDAAQRAAWDAGLMAFQVYEQPAR